MPPCNLRMQSNETTNACSKGCVILLYVASFMVHTISSNGNFNGPGSKTKLRWNPPWTWWKKQIHELFVMEDDTRSLPIGWLHKKPTPTPDGPPMSALSSPWPVRVLLHRYARRFLIYLPLHFVKNLARFSSSGHKKLGSTNALSRTPPTAYTAGHVMTQGSHFVLSRSHLSTITFLTNLPLVQETCKRHHVRAHLDVR